MLKIIALNTARILILQDRPTSLIKEPPTKKPRTSQELSSTFHTHAHNDPDIWGSPQASPPQNPWIASPYTPKTSAEIAHIAATLENIQITPEIPPVDLPQLTPNGLQNFLAQIEGFSGSGVTPKTPKDF